MRAFIYVGGDINPDMITEHPKGDDITVAADSGYENAKRLGERVDLFVGDMDSYGGEIDDLYSLSKDAPAEYHSDQTHYYTVQGTRLLADGVICCIEGQLGIKAKELDYEALMKEEKDICGM